IRGSRAELAGARTPSVPDPRARPIVAQQPTTIPAGRVTGQNDRPARPSRSRVDYAFSQVQVPTPLAPAGGPSSRLLPVHLNVPLRRIGLASTALPVSAWPVPTNWLSGSLSATRTAAGLEMLAVTVSELKSTLPTGSQVPSVPLGVFTVPLTLPP